MDFNRLIKYIVSLVKPRACPKILLRKPFKFQYYSDHQREGTKPKMWE